MVFKYIVQPYKTYHAFHGFSFLECATSGTLPVLCRPINTGKSRMFFFFFLIKFFNLIGELWQPYTL